MTQNSTDSKIQVECYKIARKNTAIYFWCNCTRNLNKITYNSVFIDPSGSVRLYNLVRMCDVLRYFSNNFHS